MSDDKLVFLRRPPVDDDATQRQSDQDRARLIMDEEVNERGDDDSTIVDPTEEMTPAQETAIPFWRWAFG
jgi:hypothetical protein